MNRITTSALVLLVTLCCAIEGGGRKKRTDIELNSDLDVTNYLKSKNRDMEKLRCKKVVMVQWLHSVLPYVDLQCEVLGIVSEVNWYFNDSLIDTAGGGRFLSLSQPHYRKRTFYNNWLNYKLRMLHVTEDDNGPYMMEVKSPGGHVDYGHIMLEVKTNYVKEKWVSWANKVDQDQSKVKNSKRSAAKMKKRREKELRRELKKITRSRRRHADRRPLIIEGQ